MADIIKSILDYLVANYALYLVVAMGIISSFTIAILALIKMPIKKLTAKIRNDRLRKLTNKIFIVFAFAISFALWFVLNVVAPNYFPIDAVEVICTGAFSVVIYALGDGVFTKSKAQQLVDSIKDFAEDEKKKKSDSAVAEYLKKVK